MPGYTVPMAASHPKTRYHHGDLRGALIAAAERLMAERSAWTFTLREVARVAGVSHNAPYNHFPDRRALLAAIAARGFEGLAATLRGALGTAGDDVSTGMRVTARAYVAFAIAHPAHYRLMFSAELAGCADAALEEAGRRAFMVLQDLVARGVVGGMFRADPHGTHALAAWSLVHGLATLLVDGKVPGAESGDGVAALTEAAAATLVEGLVAARS